MSFVSTVQEFNKCFSFEYNEPLEKVISFQEEIQFLEHYPKTSIEYFFLIQQYTQQAKKLLREDNEEEARNVLHNALRACFLYISDNAFIIELIELNDIDYQRINNLTIAIFYAEHQSIQAGIYYANTKDLKSEIYLQLFANVIYSLLENLK